MKKVFIGVYGLGYERVRLYLRPGTGANTYFLPEDKGITIMEIGADEDKFRKIVTSILHEAQEMAMCRLGLAYYPSGSLNNSTANCSFMMNHEQFDECCARAGDLLSSALPDLSKAWKEWKNPNYVKLKIVCPECQSVDKKILIKKCGRENHYRCDNCGHDFMSWRGVTLKKGKK